MTNFQLQKTEELVSANKFHLGLAKTLFKEGGLMNVYAAYCELRNIASNNYYHEVNFGDNQSQERSKAKYDKIANIAKGAWLKYKNNN